MAVLYHAHDSDLNFEPNCNIQCFVEKYSSTQRFYYCDACETAYVRQDFVSDGSTKSDASFFSSKRIACRGNRFNQHQSGGKHYAFFNRRQQSVKLVQNGKEDEAEWEEETQIKPQLERSKKQQSIDLHLQLLEHAVHCKTDCEYKNCQVMKVYLLL